MLKVNNVPNCYTNTVDPTATDDSNSGYQESDTWVNTTTDKAFICVDSSVGAAVWKDATADTPTVSPGALSSKRTTTLALPATWTDVNFDLTTLENDTSIVEHDDVNRDRFYAREAGLFFVMANLEFTNTVTNATRTCQVRLRVNDTTEVGLLSIPIGKDSTEFVTRGVTVSLNQNDWLSVQVIDDASDGVQMESNAVFTMFKINGAKGDQGPVGSGSSVSLEENGTLVTNTPHTNIDFNGTDFNVVDNGDNSATISIAKKQTLNFTFQTRNGDSKSTNTTTYAPVARFIFEGSTALAVPTKIYVNSWQAAQAGSQGKVRVYDLTNSQLIAESALITSTSSTNIVDLGAISNVPTGRAIWAIEHQGNGENKDNFISSMSVEF